MLKWILRFISDKLDRDQFGGQKGHSVAHYLIEIMNFVLYNQDLSEPLSILLCAVDLEKVFNKVDHCTTITNNIIKYSESTRMAHKNSYKLSLM